MTLMVFHTNFQTKIQIYYIYQKIAKKRKKLVKV